MSVGIVGLGYVSLPLAVNVAEAGVDVVGVDVDPAKVSGRVSSDLLRGLGLLVGRDSWGS